jgi:hypothetical protein
MKAFWPKLKAFFMVAKSYARTYFKYFPQGPLHIENVEYNASNCFELIVREKLEWKMKILQNMCASSRVSIKSMAQRNKIQNFHRNLIAKRPFIFWFAFLFIVASF